MAEAATRCWWEDSHPGWMIFTLGNQHFQHLDHVLRVRTLSIPSTLPQQNMSCLAWQVITACRHRDALFNGGIS